MSTETKREQIAWSMIRARVDSRIVGKLQRIARGRYCKVSQLIREAVIDYVRAEEARAK